MADSVHVPAFNPNADEHVRHARGAVEDPYEAAGQADTHLPPLR